MTKSQLQKVNNLADNLSDNYIVSAEFNCTPYIHISYKNIYIYGYYEFDIETKEYNINERELIDTIELNKYQIEDLISNPEFAITNILDNYFYKK